MSNSDLLTVKDVSERLQVSDRYVRLLVKRGELPAVKLGRAVRIGVADLVAFLEVRRVANAAAAEAVQRQTEKALATLHMAS